MGMALLMGTRTKNELCLRKSELVLAVRNFGSSVDYINESSQLCETNVKCVNYAGRNIEGKCFSCYVL